ncbi:MAG: hypothetical protein D6719_06070 [Candidatus Dadabacteria bacterium]|nr:MAG: hypothetical protein D6719_06070 [Candidatus Dadabacteria bacterium]
MNKLKVVSLAIVSFSLTTFSVARAEIGTSTPQEPVSQCSELIKECFVSSDTERTNCFYSSATHPFCEGTALGKLAFKRWAMSPDRSSGKQPPPALLGPQLVDKNCLMNFDNSWSSALVKGGLGQARIKSLDQKLESCRKEISIELTRP